MDLHRRLFRDPGREVQLNVSAAACLVSVLAGGAEHPDLRETVCSDYLGQSREGLVSCKGRR